MSRWSLSGKSMPLLLLVLLLACLHGPANAQNPALIYATPEEAVNDADFAVQGEYLGVDRGIQVAATGDGEFAIVIYDGGLPGDGWRGEPGRRIDGDADTVQTLIDSMNLKKVQRVSPTLGAAPPPGSIHLFDGTKESLNLNWQKGAKLTEDGLLQEGATTKATFTDYLLHLEFRTPFMPAATGQQRGNSGLYHQGRYENQILDSFGLEGTKNETGSIYDIQAPAVNACFPPLSWQTYDVVFTAATFDEAGKKLTDAKMTVRLNGVVVQSEVIVPRATRAAPLGEANTPGPIYLQDHGNPVRFRNIWIIPRDANREARRPIVPGFERFYGSITNESLKGDKIDPSGLSVGGEVLISSLGCINCHAESTLVWQSLKGPDLSSVASRVRTDYLLDWIQSPHDLKPGTTMPDVLARMDAKGKKKAAEALASYLLLAGDASEYSDRVGDARSAERGETLYHSIGCVACHASKNGETTPASTSVPLGELAKKYTLASLTTFLQDPHAIRPSGRMPKLVGDASEARDLATYLLRDAVVVPGAQQFLRTLYRGSWDNLPDFAKETPVGDSIAVAGLTFDGINRLDEFGAVYEAYLPIQRAGNYNFILGSDDGSRVLVDDREVVRVDGIHPYQQKNGKVQLDIGVHRLRVEYFEKGGEERLTLELDGEDIGKTDVAGLVTQDPAGALDQELVPATFQPKPEFVDEGRRLFVTTGCANCHDMREQGQLVGSQLVSREFSQIRNPRTKNYLQGCLSETPAAGLPDYELSPQQQQALRLALASIIPRNDQGRGEDSLNVHTTMVAANCYACHQRDRFGGPEIGRDSFFQTTTMEMGNEGRLPPPLTGVADKLTDKFIAKYLEEGANERPYMKTRMPAFGYESLKSLHDSMVRLDRISHQDHPDEPQTAVRMKADGRTLVGNDGLACVKCHTFNGEGTPGIQAIDMLKMTDRLRDDWFHRYLLDPQKYRPGTRMPASFPDGVSVLKTIAEGDAKYQIDAMWLYLKDGKRAKIPAGLRPGAIELVPGERPIIYRNFLTDVSPRGIAVGYPEGVHLAWDANTMTLRKIWQNQFLDASLHWQGRGPGNLAPLGDLVQVVETSSPLAVLESIDGSWPEKTDDSAGYKFKGYSLDSLGRPAFKYSIGELNVVESYVPASEEDGSKVLVREFQISGPEQSVVIRFAVGDIQAEADGWFLINNAYRVLPGGVSVEVVTINGRAELRGLAKGNRPAKISEVIRW